MLYCAMLDVVSAIFFKKFLPALFTHYREIATEKNHRPNMTRKAPQTAIIA